MSNLAELKEKEKPICKINKQIKITGQASNLICNHEAERQKKPPVSSVQ
jgi:hypothetical protein